MKSKFIAGIFAVLWLYAELLVPMLGFMQGIGGL